MDAKVAQPVREAPNTTEPADIDLMTLLTIRSLLSQNPRQALDLCKLVSASESGKVMAPLHQGFLIYCQIQASQALAETSRIREDIASALPLLELAQSPSEPEASIKLAVQLKERLVQLRDLLPVKEDVASATAAIYLV